MAALREIVGCSYPAPISQPKGEHGIPVTIEVDPKIQYSKLVGKEFKPAEFDPRTKQETIFEHPPFTDI